MGILFARMPLWRSWISWNWSYRQLWAVMWMLGIEPRSFRRAVSALNLWAISPVPTSHSLPLRVLFCLSFFESSHNLLYYAYFPTLICYSLFYLSLSPPSLSYSLSLSSFSDRYLGQWWLENACLTRWGRTSSEYVSTEMSHKCGKPAPQCNVSDQNLQRHTYVTWVNQ